jgi:polysaccharide pyruvyl transferase WcaK-like protein
MRRTASRGLRQRDALRLKTVICQDCAAPSDQQLSTALSFGDSPNLRPRQQVYYAALTQFENVGDALINRELLRALSRRANVYCYVGQCPRDYVAQLEQPGSVEVDRSLNRMLVDLAIAGLNSLGRSPLQRPVLLATPGDVNGSISLNNALKGVTYAMLRALGVRIWRLGVSFTHLSRPRAAAEEFALRFMERIAVRDSSSADFVRSSGVEPHSLPDLSFLLPFADVVKAPERRQVAISFRDQDLSETEATKLMTKVLSLCSFVGDQGFTPVLTVQVARDLQFAKQVQAAASGHLPIRVLKTIQEAEVFYDECILALSNRLHVLLLAASRACLPLAALREGHNQKIRVLFDDVGFGDRMVDWNVSWEQAVESTLQNRSNILERVSNAFELKAREINSYLDRAFLPEAYRA